MGIDKKWHKAQVDAFANRRDLYVRLAEHLRSVLQAAAHELGVSAIVQVRAKTVPSFAEKALRKAHKYANPVLQLTDLCGGRVIADTLEEVNRVCEYIRTHFEVDEANSEDVLARLRAAEFGYRSVHFVVTPRPGVFAEIPAEFAAVHTKEEADRQGVLPGPVFKAEIQVRTLLQHAYASVAHDTLYKGGFPVPAAWNREAARIAALLENTDACFARMVEAMAAFRTDHGAYMTKAQMRDEFRTLGVMARYAPKDRKLARKRARLAMTLGRPACAVRLLEPFAQSGPHLLRRDLGEALLRTGAPDALARGREMLTRCTQDEQGDARAWRLLGASYDQSEPDTAFEHFSRAYKAAPNEPGVLRGFLERKIVRDRRADFVALMQPAIRASVDLALTRAGLKLELPQSYLDAAMLLVLAGEPFQGLSAYAKAAHLAGPEAITAKSVDRLGAMARAAGRDVEGLSWAWRMLVALMAFKARTGAPALKADPALAALDACQGLARPHPELYEGEVVLVAGGCSAQSGPMMERHRDLLYAAFEDFRGTVICGGTTAGISGIVGDLPGVRQGRIRLVSYLPRRIPNHAVVHTAYEMLEVHDAGFTPLGPIQAWMDMLASGVDPARVKMLGVGGGLVAGFEYALAAAMSARVGLLAESGGAALRTLQDPVWAEAVNVLPLPADRTTLWEFMSPRQAPVFDAAAAEGMARQVHENYQRDQQNRFTSKDPAMADWDELPDDLKGSCLDQVAHYETKLRVVGLAVRKITDPDRPPFELTPDQIEAMAEVEHARWNVERLGKGWRLGERNVDGKTSPHILSWADLAEGVKYWDVQAVANIPELLWQAGYEVYEATPEGHGGAGGPA